MIAEAVYVLCAGTCATCAVLLARQYRRRRTPLLLWSALCFTGFTLNNLLLVADFVVYPSVDLAVWRGVTAVASVMTLLYGLIWGGR